jgi:uncharacterized protein (UPF0335 family)
MYTTEIEEMVYRMGKMIENVERLLEEMKRLQDNVETRLQQSGSGQSQTPKRKPGNAISGGE